MRYRAVVLQSLLDSTCIAQVAVSVRTSFRSSATLPIIHAFGLHLGFSSSILWILKIIFSLHLVFVYSKILQCLSDNAYWPVVSCETNIGQEEYVFDCFFFINTIRDTEYNMSIHWFSSSPSYAWKPTEDKRQPYTYWAEVTSAFTAFYASRTVNFYYKN